MLLNNFKPLLFFGGSGTLKDVSGATVNVSDYLQLASADGANNVGHDHYGAGRTFNYTTTDKTNTYTDEQTAYQYTFEGQTSNANTFLLYVGSGNTTVTSSDYKLATPVALNVVAAYCTHNSGGKIMVSRTFVNNTGSDVTIRELGLYVTQGSAYASYYAVMIGRKVLDSPVVIPDGEQRTFEYIVDMNNISFSDLDD